MSNWNGTAYHLGEADVESAYRTILASDLVQTRREYLARLALETQLEISDSKVVNAGAGRIPLEQVMTQGSEEPDQTSGYVPKKYVIVVNQGLLDWSSALAVVTATLDRTGSTRKARSMLKWMRKAVTVGCAGNDLLLRMWHKFRLEEDSVQEEVSRMYAKTILLEVLAHECGHVCLGHAPYPGQDAHMSISRNDERQADSFASSVIQSSCLGAQGAVGAAMSNIGFMWIHDAKDGDMRYGSHPDNMERLEKFLGDFNAILTVSHVSRKQLLELLP
jgi:hypothetical protein